MRHPFTGHVTVSASDDLRAFDRFTAEIVEGLRPENIIERQLAHLYAGYAWRMHRAVAIEETLLSVGTMEDAVANIRIQEPRAKVALSRALSFRRRARTFQTLSRYSQSLLKQGMEVLGRLQQLQARRREEAEPAAKTTAGAA